MPFCPIKNHLIGCTASVLLPQRSAVHGNVLACYEARIDEIQRSISNVLGPSSAVRRMVFHVLL